MKVVFINRFFYPDLSATSQLLSDLAFHLAASGMTVHVVASRLRYDDPMAALPSQELIQGVHVHRVWTSRFGRGNLAGRVFDYLTFYLSAASQLLAVLAKGDVLVIKTDPPLIGLIAAPCARLRGARVINWLQDIFPEVARELGMRVAGGWLGERLGQLRDMTLRSADMNVVLGERMAAYLATRSVPSDRIAVVHNWSDGDAIKPLPARENALRHQWQLDGAFIVGYSGNLGRAHEFETALEAASLLTGHPHIVFLFIGDGQGRATMEREAQRRGLHNVRFMPYQPRAMLPYSLTLFDAHLVSLRPELEGLIVPSKLYGALAAGRPILFLGDLQGEVPLILTHHECGRAFEIGCARDLADAILAWRGNPAFVQQMGERARLAYEQRFTKIEALDCWVRQLRALDQGPSI